MEGVSVVCWECGVLNGPFKCTFEVPKNRYLLVIYPQMQHYIAILLPDKPRPASCNAQLRGLCPGRAPGVSFAIYVKILGRI